MGRLPVSLSEIAEKPAANMGNVPQDTVLAFVRALARRQARLDAQVPLPTHSNGADKRCPRMP